VRLQPFDSYGNLQASIFQIVEPVSDRHRNRYRHRDPDPDADAAFAAASSGPCNKAAGSSNAMRACSLDGFGLENPGREVHFEPGEPQESASGSRGFARKIRYVEIACIAVLSTNKFTSAVPVSKDMRA
jgi:hypothetical protein